VTPSHSAARVRPSDELVLFEPLFERDVAFATTEAPATAPARAPAFSCRKEGRKERLMASSSSSVVAGAVTVCAGSRRTVMGASVTEAPTHVSAPEDSTTDGPPLSSATHSAQQQTKPFFSSRYSRRLCSGHEGRSLGP
jgi:hypothetical protein